MIQEDRQKAGPAGAIAGAPAPGGHTSVVVVAIMMLLNVADGFDVLAMSFAAPSIVKTFALTPRALGLLFSTGFLGMAIGAVGLARLADRIGRRPMLIACLLLMTAGMAMSAVSPSLGVLYASRLLTGLGIGGMLPTLNTVVAEFTRDRHRALAISIVTTGFALGGMIGGLVSIPILADHGWRGLFAAGALVNVVCTIGVLVLVPESPLWRVQRGMDARREAVALQAPGPDPLERAQLRRQTWLLMLTYSLAMIGFYSFVSWLPKLSVERGVPFAAAAHAVTLITAGSVAGGLSFALLRRLASSRRVTMTAFLIEALTLAAIAANLEHTEAADALCAVFGFVNGLALVGLYALLAESFPTATRATASGLVVGAGRVGAIVGPAACGVLLSWGFGDGAIYTMLAAALGLAGASLLPLRDTVRLRLGEPVPPPLSSSPS